MSCDTTLCHNLALFFNAIKISNINKEFSRDYEVCVCACLSLLCVCVCVYIYIYIYITHTHNIPLTVQGSLRK